MKKAAAFFMALALTVITSSGVFAATASSVKVSGTNAKTVTYQYTPGSESSKAVSSLMTELSKLTKKNKSVTQVLTLTSESSDNSPVDFKLRLTSAETPKATPKTSPLPSASPEAAQDYSDLALAFYDVTVRDSAGTVISTSKMGGEDIYKDDDGTLMRDIDLGVLNKQSGKETKLYNVEVAIDGNAATSKITDAQKYVKWQIMNEPAVDATPAPTKAAEDDGEKETPAAVQTETPKATEAAAVQTQQPAVQRTTAPTAAPADLNTPSPTASADPDKKGGTKYIGTDKDIKPGRYVATGNGMVKVYNSDDELKTSILLSDGKGQTGNNGVDSYVLNLTEGQRLEYADYINLKPYSAATASPKAAATATPRAAATASPKAAATARPAAAATAQPSAAHKTNPKTGDETPIAGVSVIAVFALGMFIFMQVSKRKDD